MEIPVCHRARVRPSEIYPDHTFRISQHFILQFSRASFPHPNLVSYCTRPSLPAHDFVACIFKSNTRMDSKWSISPDIRKIFMVSLSVSMPNPVANLMPTLQHSEVRAYDGLITSDYTTLSSMPVSSLGHLLVSFAFRVLLCLLGDLI